MNRLQRVWRAPLPAWLRLTQALLELSPYQPDSRHLQSPSAGRRSSGSLLVTQESRPPPAHRRHLSGPKPQARLPLICLTQDVVRVWPDRQRKPTQFHKERRGRSTLLCPDARWAGVEHINKALRSSRMSTAHCMKQPWLMIQEAIRGSQRGGDQTVWQPL